ncbi:hypothetical protein [Paraburkholderia atlantica]|uniref:hypothetical protein n=1 Tax=Paraburkholderia atlantica TaxID=2654982 RepID=UPI0017B73F2B|nr:hypothetical protein [Paraburkholderia atlantica]MBB5508172.1 cytoskeletal protein RodZ [Paraburkholderia atlantica]
MKRLLPFLLLLASLPAFAQFTPGQVLTAAQLNSALAAKTNNASAAITGGTISGLSSFAVPSLTSSTHNAISAGSNLNHFNGQYWLNSPITFGANLTLSTPGSGETSPNEFLGVFQTNQQSTPLPTGVTNATTASGNNVLHFASNPSGLVVGMQITDTTALGAIPGNTTITSLGSGTVTMSNNAAGGGVGNGDTIYFGFPYFKGPIFASTFTSDASVGLITKSSNAITSYSVIPNGMAGAWAEGIVTVAMDQGGSGSEIGLESDIGPTNNSNSNHCDLATSTVSNCHTNLWVSNLGTVNGSWVLDTGNGGSGWNNGIGLRYVASGGTALLIPNNTFVNSINAAGSGTFTLINGDSSNLVQIGSGSAGVTLNAFTQTPALQINEAGSGTSSLTVYAPSDTNGANIKLVGNGGTTPNKYIRAQSGNLQVLNSAYSAVVATLTDAGNLSVTGTGTMPVYGTTGTAVNAPHMVTGSVALSSGTATVTLSSSAVFTSSSSYVCTANDTTAAAAVKVSQSSGTSITFTGTSTDTVQFACAGN